MTIRHSLVAVVAAATLVVTGCSTSPEEGTPEEAASGTAASVAASSTESSGAEDTVTIVDNHGEKEIHRPIGKVAATDNRSFEILADWGIDLVAAPKSLIPPTIDKYRDDDSVVDLGSHREPNLEALAAAQPDLVVNGQRFAKYDDDIAELVPDGTVIDLEPRITRVEKSENGEEKRVEGEPLDKELIRQVEALGTIFGKEAEAKKIIDDFTAALDRARAAYDGTSTVMAVNVTGGDINYIAPTVGRTFGPIFDLLDLKPALEVDKASSDHKGDDVSVEAIAETNPDWLFVLDRDAAISTRNEPGYKPAQEIITGNPALKELGVVKENHMVFAPEDTYTNESILTYTEILNAIADAFE